jgi:hypothetical protein
LASRPANRLTLSKTTPQPFPVKNSIGCLVNLHKMPITRFEMLGDRAKFRRARARRQVLEVIAGKANPDGTGSYVSDRYITSKTGFVKRHVIRIRQELQELGLLDWTDGRGFIGKKKGWGSNRYTVSMEESWPRQGEMARVFGLNGDISKYKEGLNGDISKVEWGHKDVTQPPFLPPKPLPPQRSPQDSSSAPVENTETAERRFNGDFKKLLKKTSPPSAGRPANPLRAELWDGIFGKRLENVFVDSQRLTFKEQLRACVEAAVTDLVHNRRGKMIHIRAEEIAKAAHDLLNGAAAVRDVPDFTDRARQCVIAVRNAVVAAAADLYEKQVAQTQGAA